MSNEKARQKTLLETGQATPGDFRDNTSWAQHPSRDLGGKALSAARQSRPSRRGGRSFPEKSGRDVARELLEADRQYMTPEQREAQREINSRGAANVREALRRAREQKND